MAKEKFEEKMNKLSKIVEDLDDEEISLDDGIKLYEEGLKLSKELQEQLKSFEDKINELDKDN